MADIRRVLVIYVGGTIGMKKKNGVYVPEQNYMVAEIRRNPTLHDESYAKKTSLDKNTLALPESNGIRVVYTIKEDKELKDSSNVNVQDWIDMATDIKTDYDNYIGFVIIHGTDTMAYTASSLSFMIENLHKPVIITGSQIPLAEQRSDGWSNLHGAIYIAGHYKIPEVGLFFNNKLFRGNRCSKKSSESFDAFISPNFPPLLTMAVEVDVRTDLFWEMGDGNEFIFNSHMNRNVAIFRVFPSITEKTLQSFLQAPMEGVVLQTYGVGNFPDNRPELREILQRARQRGVILLNCTQCPEGGLSDSYATGKVLTDAGVILGDDITPEAALSKLGYVLGKTSNREERLQKLEENLRGEITQRRIDRHD
ncbi:L-asparaginase-like [Lytechinus pictus]|uniref:L-asparaginase-like n=1 Tax=Lytechinus pictus TaxID=7653 RepID=UPI0030BA0C39